jgi:hypothetical protein
MHTHGSFAYGCMQHIHSHKYTHTRMFIYTHACMHSHTHINTHTYIYIHTRTYIHMHIYSHIHMHVHRWAKQSLMRAQAAATVYSVCRCTLGTCGLGRQVCICVYMCICVCKRGRERENMCIRCVGALSAPTDWGGRCVCMHMCEEKSAAENKQPINHSNTHKNPLLQASLSSISSI